MISIALVKCKYCGKQFDRAKVNHYRIPYGSKFRYSHIDCYKEAKVNGTEKNEGELVELDKFSPCIFCSKLINLSNERFVQVQTNKYAHFTCFQKDQVREKTDQEKLDEYIIKLFDLDYVTPKIRKQIEKYLKENRFTLTGILSSLKYFYEVKKNSTEDANDGIGIVPYIYETAKNYYYALYMTNLANREKNIQDYIPKVVEVKVTPQKRKPFGHNKFSMVEKDDVNE